MKRTFLRNHLVAWMAAVVFACPSAVMLGAMIPPNFILEEFSSAFLPFLILSILAVLFIWRLAILLGSDDLLAIIAGSMAVAFSFGVGYSSDISIFLPDDGHTFFDVLGAGARPFDFWGQFRIFSVLFVWAAAVVGGGITVKRWSESRSATAKAALMRPKETRRLGLWLVFDLGLIVCATFAILRVEVLNRVVQGTPEYLIHTLLSDTSSIEERREAIWKLSRIDTDESTEALRRAAKEQQFPLNLMADASLLERNDISGLPLLEVYLMHAPQTVTTQTTTTRGWGISSTVSGTTWTMNFGNDLGNIKDPAAIPILTHLMTSADVETRRGAARALGNIHTEATIDPLSRGLDDSDVEVEYHSVMGLAETSGAPYNGWCPARAIFGQNKQYYLDHWKEWARERTQVKL